MDHDQFVAIVRDQGGLPDGAPAEACTHSALEALGARLSGGLADSLAAHLPGPEAAALRRRPLADEARPGGMEELAADLASRAGLDPVDAQNVLQATIRAVVEAVPDREQLDRVRDQLPPALATLFGRTEESGGRYRSASGG